MTDHPHGAGSQELGGQGNTLAPLEVAPGCVRTRFEGEWRDCRGCHAKFWAVRSWQHYCSDPCRSAARHERDRKRLEDLERRAHPALPWDESERELSNTERLRRWWQPRRGQWISGLTLEGIGIGKLAWRTEVSRLRGLVAIEGDGEIERARVEAVKGEDGRWQMHSWYRWTLPAETQAAMIETEAVI